MSISFTDGVEGVKARDYSVFIREPEYAVGNSTHYESVMTECPAVNLTYPIDFDFLTGLNNLEVERTMPLTGGIIDNDDLNKVLNVPRSSICNCVIDYTHSAGTFDCFIFKVYDNDGSFDYSKKLTINLNSRTFIINSLGNFQFTHDEDGWFLKQVGFHSIGVMTKDSINPKIEDGLTVDLNISGTKVLDKTATFSFSLMNLVVDNIAQMEALDKKKVEFLLLSSDKKQLYVFKPIVFSYSEDFKSGQVSTLPITLTKKITDVEDFREVRDVSNLS